MEYVVDASVAIKWFLPEAHSDRADILLDGFVRHGLSLVAPDVFLPEVGNTLWKRSVLRGEVSISQAEQSYVDFLRLGIPLQSSSVIAEQAFNMAARESHPVYDMLYIVLAEARACELITADQALVNKLGRKFPIIRWLGSL